MKPLVFKRNFVTTDEHGLTPKSKVNIVFTSVYLWLKHPCKSVARKGVDNGGYFDT